MIGKPKAGRIRKPRKPRLVGMKFCDVILKICPKCGEMVEIVPQGGRCDCGNTYELFDNFNEIVWDSELDDNY